MAYSQKQIIDALVDSKGLIFVAAKAVGCHPATIYDYAQKFPAVQETIETERGALTDKAESRLFDAIEKGEAWAICFYLKTQGKSRGYVERQELSGPDGGKLEINVNYADSKPDNS